MEKSRNNDKRPIKRKMAINLLEIGLEFGLILAIPLLTLIGLGLYLDKKYDTVPLFILIGLFIALSLSTYALYKKINTIFEKLADQPKK